MDSTQTIASTAREWLLRQTGRDLTTAELEALHAWLQEPAHTRALARERQAWADLSALADRFAERPPAAKSRWRRRILPAITAMAAAIAAVLATPQALLWWQADSWTGSGEVRTIRLPDGSTATLDGDSAIAVAYSGQARTVELLRGRAWFAVRHGDARPFAVRFKDGVARDIGTAFEVEQLEIHSEVAVTEGIVEVRGHNGGALRLGAGQRGIVRTDGVARPLHPLPTDQIATWRNGELLLRDMALDRAITAIARYRSAPVFVWGDLSNTPTVSGAFRIDRPDEALATLAAMRGLDRVELPGGILILRR